MTNTIKCPYCHKEFEAGEAFAAKYKRELEEEKMYIGKEITN